MPNGAIAINRQQASEFLYGSHSWWEKSDRKAIEGIRRGGGKRFTNVKEAVNYLHS